MQANCDRNVLCIFFNLDQSDRNLRNKILASILLISLPAITYAQGSPQGINRWLERQMRSHSNTPVFFLLLLIGGFLASLLPCIRCNRNDSEYCILQMCLQVVCTQVKKERVCIIANPHSVFVGVIRLERTTTCTPCKYASQLRHTPHRPPEPWCRW